MELYWKAGAMILVSLMVCLVLGQMGREFSSLAAMAACVMVAGAVIGYLRPLGELVRQLWEQAYLPGESGEILLKCLAVSLTGEWLGMLCRDAGVSSLAQGVKLLSGAVMLYLSIPVMESILKLIQEILGCLQ